MMEAPTLCFFPFVHLASHKARAAMGGLMVLHRRNWPQPEASEGSDQFVDKLLM